MKKLLSALLVCVFLITCACKATSNINSSSDVGVSPSGSASDTVTLKGTKIEISSEKSEYPIGINGSTFYFLNDKDNNDDTADESYYTYNLKTKEKTFIGTVNNCTTASGTYAFLDNGKVIFSQGVRGDNENQFFMLNSSAKEITLLRQDNCFPPLVYTEPIDNTHYLEFQPERINDDGGYNYHLRIGDSDGNIKTIVTKQRVSYETGTTISCYDTDGDTLYTFEYLDDEYRFCYYDLDGNMIFNGQLDVISEFIEVGDDEQDYMNFIEAENGYILLSTDNGRNLMLKKTENGFEKVEVFNDSQSLNYVSSSTPDDGKFFMYDLDKSQLVMFDSTTLQTVVYILEGSTRQSYVTTDGNTVVYSDKDGEYFYATLE